MYNLWEKMECPYCKEDIKEGAIKCKHCGSMLNETTESAITKENTKPQENTKIKSKEEKVFCTADGIKVTSNRFIVGSNTYSVSNISSVKIGSESAIGKIISILVFIFGVILTTVSPIIGIPVFIISIIIFIMSGKTYSVVISTNSGESTALKDKNKEAIVGIVEAINKAIEYKDR